MCHTLLSLGLKSQCHRNTEELAVVITCICAQKPVIHGIYRKAGRNKVTNVRRVGSALATQVFARTVSDAETRAQPPAKVIIGCDMLISVFKAAGSIIR